MKKEETDDFQPFIPADKIVPEFTVTSIVLGVLLASFSALQTHIWACGSA